MLEIFTDRAKQHSPGPLFTHCHFCLKVVSFSDITNPSHHNWDVFQSNVVSNKTNLLHGQLSLSAVVLNAKS